ncbi:MAG TPA: hypothetical protein VLE74_00145 [Candidatus Saccharimonadales bacterium]|nr:hypothetical protein [Candidatus Saccharimonadales bacterium]
MASSRKYQRNPERTPEQISELNRQAHEEAVDYRTEPGFREVTSAEAKEHLERRRLFIDDLHNTTSLSDKAAAALAFSDDEAAIRARYTGQTDTPVAEETDEALDIETAAINQAWGRGVVWDPYSHDLPPEVQREQGYGPPLPHDPEE